MFSLNERGTFARVCPLTSFYCFELWRTHDKKSITWKNHGLHQIIVWTMMFKMTADYMNTCWTFVGIMIWKLVQCHDKYMIWIILNWIMSAWKKNRWCDVMWRGYRNIWKWFSDNFWKISINLSTTNKKELSNGSTYKTPPPPDALKKNFFVFFNETIRNYIFALKKKTLFVVRFLSESIDGMIR